MVDLKVKDSWQTESYAMAVVDFEQGTLSIDANVIARGLNVEPSLVQGQMREEKSRFFASVESTKT
jgi:Family of unknown function (DUF6522)